jgi:hypothetical protein
MYSHALLLPSWCAWKYKNVPRAQETPRRGEGGNNPIKPLNRIHEIQRGQEAPHNGNTFLPKDVQMTPLHLKGLIDPNMDTRLLGGLEGVSGFPSGHPEIDGGHPGLLENVSKGVLVVKMLPASFGLKKVENETFEDV